MTNKSQAQSVVTERGGGLSWEFDCKNNIYQILDNDLRYVLCMVYLSCFDMQYWVTGYS